MHPALRHAIVQKQIDPFTKLLMHCDGPNGATAFIDNSFNRRTVTAVGTAQISTAQSKFGGASFLGDGTGDNLTIPASTDWDLRGVDSTLECWAYANSLVAPATVRILLGTAVLNQYIVYVYANGSVAVGINGVNEIVTAAGVITTGVWYHIAVVRVNSTGRTDIYVDGTTRVNATTDWTTDPGSNTFNVGGGSGTATQDWNGYIDEVRISKNIARWTADFTPPTSPYSA